MNNYVRNEFDDHLPNRSDAQDEGLFNSETETKNVLKKIVNLKVMQFEVELHQRESIIGPLKEFKK